MANKYVALSPLENFALSMYESVYDAKKNGRWKVQKYEKERLLEEMIVNAISKTNDLFKQLVPAKGKQKQIMLTRNEIALIERSSGAKNPAKDLRIRTRKMDNSKTIMSFFERMLRSKLAKAASKKFDRKDIEFFENVQLKKRYMDLGSDYQQLMLGNIPDKYSDLREQDEDPKEPEEPEEPEELEEPNEPEEAGEESESEEEEEEEVKSPEKSLPRVMELINSRAKLLNSMDKRLINMNAKLLPLEYIQAIAKAIDRNGVKHLSQPIFELVTGVKIDEMSDHKTLNSYLDPFLKKVEKSQLKINGYKYLGPMTGGVDTLSKLETPLNKLDIFAMDHDYTYLKASVIYRDNELMFNKSIKDADALFIEKCDKLAQKLKRSGKMPNLMNDAETSARVMRAKEALPYSITNILKTHGVKELEPKDIPEIIQILDTGLKQYVAENPQSVQNPRLLEGIYKALDESKALDKDGENLADQIYDISPQRDMTDRWLHEGLQELQQNYPDAYEQGLTITHHFFDDTLEEKRTTEIKNRENIEILLGVRSPREGSAADVIPPIARPQQAGAPPPLQRGTPPPLPRGTPPPLPRGTPPPLPRGTQQAGTPAPRGRPKKTPREEIAEQQQQQRIIVSNEEQRLWGIAQEEKKNQDVIDEAKRAEEEKKAAEPVAEKKPMGIEDIVSSIKELNEAQSKQAKATAVGAGSTSSLNPITGERNMRPLLMKGDYKGVIELTKREKENNFNFYANWKWVQSGFGNGNQQPMPDQVGVPFNNHILAAYYHNEQLKYIDNYDAGAMEWHKQNAPYRVRPTPNTLAIFNTPMIRDRQNFQAPTRNGSLPAGVGRPIKMARETANGFDIFTPNQLKNSFDTRLYNGDVVDGQRV